MKRIIKNKLYDTEKAKALGCYEPNPYRSDFHWYCETLYQKKTGEFFLHGDGNAASKYSRSCGQNEWCGSESIIPLSYDEAQEWAEGHLNGDDYIAIFGEPEETDEKVRLTVYMNSATVQKFKTEAAKRGVSVGDFIESLVP